VKIVLRASLAIAGYTQVIVDAYRKQYKMVTMAALAMRQDARRDDTDRRRSHCADNWTLTVIRHPVLSVRTFCQFRSLVVEQLRK
jgi:hypothetical protein